MKPEDPLSPGVHNFPGPAEIGFRSAPIAGWRAAAKRAMDLCGAAVLLALLGIPMLIIALLVKLTSPGPALFRQERVGLGGRPFVLVKFRTMRVDAEKETGPVWASDRDLRRTRLGVWLRRSSLDELPQLFNVLWGQMSLVGPRPERPHFARRFAQEFPAYMLRHNVKAGLTGWAQINGFRGNTSVTQRLQHDIFYINHWSLGLDILILCLTPFLGLVNRNAY